MRPLPLGLALLLLAPALAGCSAPPATPVPPGGSAAGTCAVTPAQAEGPYFVRGMPERSDLSAKADGSPVPGILLRLVLSVSRLGPAGCTPIPGARIDLWHADASGRYSGVHGDRDTFLRGHQSTDAAGAAVFSTIYPGWYPGRAVHTHAKVTAGASSLTTQLYANDTTSDQVFGRAPYNARGKPDTPNARDGIFGQGGAQLLLDIQPQGDGYVGRYGFVLPG